MKNDRGFVFVLTLCLSIMALAGVQSSIIETKSVGNDLMKAQAFQSRVGREKHHGCVI